MKYICLEPTCDYCIDQVQFDQNDKCPNCGSTNIHDTSIIPYLPQDLFDKLKELRKSEKQIYNNIADIKRVR